MYLLIFTLMCFFLFPASFIKAGDKGVITDKEFVIEKERKNLIDNSERIFLPPNLIKPNKKKNKIIIPDLEVKNDILFREILLYDDFSNDTLLKNISGIVFKSVFLNSYLGIGFNLSLPIKKFDGFNLLVNGSFLGLFNNRDFKLEIKPYYYKKGQSHTLKAGIYKTNSFIKGYDPTYMDNNHKNGFKSRGSKISYFSCKWDFSNLNTYNSKFQLSKLSISLKGFDVLGLNDKNRIKDFSIFISPVFKLSFADKYNFNTISSIYSNFADLNNFLFNLLPKFPYEIRKLSSNLGLSISVGNNSYKKTYLFLIMPYLDFYYKYDNKINFYGSFYGNIEGRSYLDLVKSNPCFREFNEVKNVQYERKPIVLNLGINFSVYDDLVINFQADITKYSNLFFFKRVNINNKDSMNDYFEVLYKETLVFSPELAVSQKINTSLNYLLKVNYYLYSMEGKPLHKPKYKAECNINYDLYTNLSLFSELQFLGGILFKEALALNNFINVNLGGNYRINNDLVAFLKVLNLFNRDNPLYNGFVSRGIQINVGILFCKANLFS